MNTTIHPLLEPDAALPAARAETGQGQPAESSIPTLRSVAGNLRHGTSSLVLWCMGKDREKNRGQAIVSFTIFACYLLGAFLGGLYTRYDTRHALAPAVVLIAGGFILTWRQRLISQAVPPLSQ